MVGRHYPFNGREFEQALGDGEGQGSLTLTLERPSQEEGAGGVGLGSPTSFQPFAFLQGINYPSCACVLFYECVGIILHI